MEAIHVESRGQAEARDGLKGRACERLNEWERQKRSVRTGDKKRFKK